VDDIQSRGVAVEHVVSALRETVEQLLELGRAEAGAAGAAGADGAGAGASLLTFLLTNGSLMLGYCRGRELAYSTHKRRCPERETCYAFEEARCERPARDGIVKHLIVTSERTEEGHNVWQELGEDEYVAVGPGMNLTRARLLG